MKTVKTKPAARRPEWGGIRENLETFGSLLLLLFHSLPAEFSLPFNPLGIFAPSRSLMSENYVNQRHGPALHVCSWLALVFGQRKTSSCPVLSSPPPEEPLKSSNSSWVSEVGNYTASLCSERRGPFIPLIRPNEWLFCWEARGLEGKDW